MKSMKTWSGRAAVGRVFVVLLLGSAPFACGNTDSDTEGTAGGGSGGTSGASASGGGGTTAGTKPVGTGGSRAGATSTGGAQADGGSPPEAPGGLPGTSETSKTVQCGGEACKSIPTLLPNVFVDPCCTTDDACGTSSEVLSVIGASFAETCQARAQEGERTEECPSSAPRELEVGGMNVTANGFAGCCRAATGTCGVIVNDIQAGFIAFAKPGLGCVDSAPFFDQQPGAPCGAAGAGGAPSGGASAGGAPADGGVSGAP